MTLEEILARCEPCGECMVWKGFSAKGRPIAHPDSRTKQVPVRRLVLELRDGPMPPKTYARPTCATPGCVWHVKAMTRSEQMLSSDTRARGDAHSAALRPGKRATAPKLSVEAAARMRSLRAEGWTYERLGKEFGVHLSMAARVCAEMAWAVGPTRKPPPPRARPSTEEVFQMRILRAQGSTYPAIAKQFAAPLGFVVRVCRPKITVIQRLPGRYEVTGPFERAISADWALRRQGVPIPTLKEYP